jgi:precorrin-2 dehydrogenase/sirohydrochlorin ferrochelatase
MNTLYPVFLKSEKLHFLIVGGGYVGTEKLSFLLKSSPETPVKVVAPFISDEIHLLASQHTEVKIVQKAFEPEDLEGIQIVIAGTALKEVNHEVWKAAKSKNILVNVADTPELCDFYLGSIVTKGDLKIAISTNGQSPTFAKRLREMLEDVLPESIDGILAKLTSIRQSLKGDFAQKIEQLDEITSVLTKKK